MDLREFFQEQGIDIFSEVSVTDLPDEDRFSVLQFFPAARSVIVFGKGIPAPVYRMPPKEKTHKMLRIAESLDNSAVRLAGLLRKERVPAVSVPLYLPVRVINGRVQGVVRLKQIAAAAGIGSTGRNTVLLVPGFGPRLLLSGVVTGRAVQEPVPGGSRAGRDETPLCRGCGNCIRVCPAGALGPRGVDAFRCRTVSAWVPPVLVPVAKWVLGQERLLRTIAPLAPLIAGTATIRCSLCVTECPNFSGNEKESLLSGGI